jgi:hypothetical protein
MKESPVCTLYSDSGSAKVRDFFNAIYVLQQTKQEFVIRYTDAEYPMHETVTLLALLP